MPTFVADHHLKNFDEWLKLFKANPPPPVGRWRVVRGIDDPNHVFVVGDVDEASVQKVNDFWHSERMTEIIRKVDAMSTAPLKSAWFNELPPQR